MSSESPPWHQRKRVKKRTRARGARRMGRVKGSKNKTTIERELLAKRELLSNGKLAVEIMDEEIERFAELEKVLYPWNERGEKLKDKSTNAYFWCCEMRRDYISLRAPYQSPRLSAVQMLPMQNSGKRTTVNVTILNERGEKVFSDVPDDVAEEREPLKLIEGSLDEQGGT